MGAIVPSPTGIAPEGAKFGLPKLANADKVYRRLSSMFIAIFLIKQFCLAPAHAPILNNAPPLFK
jgi:hypothetical protein